jgi:hypothetical protein
MTIHVHPEVLVQLQQSPSSSHDDFLIKNTEPLSAAAGPSCCSRGGGSRRRSSHSQTDDDQTVDTISTASSDSFSDCGSRVSFAEELVTDVWTRPATEDDELTDLFYSKEETDRYVGVFCSAVPSRGSADDFSLTVKIFFFFFFLFLAFF